VIEDARSLEMSDAFEAVINELRSAFPPYPLDVQTAFDQFGVTYTDGASFQAGAQDRRWDELPPAFLEFHHDALLFLGPPVAANVLPAYLAAALRRDPALDMLPLFLVTALTRDIDNNTTRFDAQFGPLSPTQRLAVSHALEAWAGSFASPDRRRALASALDSYWRTIG
jgi:hypothetical protein